MIRHVQTLYVNMKHVKMIQINNMVLEAMKMIHMIVTMKRGFIAIYKKSSMMQFI
jgi:hypothetical protein